MAISVEALKAPIVSHRDKRKQKMFEEWFEERPVRIKKMIVAHPAFDEKGNSKQYKLGEQTSAYYLVHSYEEDGTLTMTRISAVTGEALWNVFGIDPKDLTEWHHDA